MAAPTRPRYRPRRWGGQASDAPHRRPRQAGGALRGHVPAHRLRPVEPHQLAVPARHRADPVQVAQPRPAHRRKTWRMSPLLGNYVAPVPGAAARRQALVPGQRRRHLPVPQHHRGRAPDIVVVVGADHVYRMDFSQMVDAHIDSGAEFTVAAIRQPIERGRPVRRHRGRPDGPDAHHGVPREADRPGGPGRLPRRGPRVDGQLRRSTRTRSSTPSTTDADDADSQPRHGRRHRARTSSSAARRASTTSSATTCPARPTATATTGATSERSTSFYEAHMDLISVAAGVQPLQRRVADLHRARSTRRPRSSSAPARAGSAHAVDSIVSLGVRGLRRAPSNGSSSPRACGCTRGRRSPTRCSSTTCTSAGTPQVHRAILDKNVVVPERVRIGVDHDHDRARGFTVTESGITVVRKGTVIAE